MQRLPFNRHACFCPHLITYNLNMSKNQKPLTNFFVNKQETRESLLSSAGRICRVDQLLWTMSALVLSAMSMLRPLQFSAFFFAQRTGMAGQHNWHSISNFIGTGGLETDKLSGGGIINKWRAGLRADEQREKLWACPQHFARSILDFILRCHTSLPCYYMV